MGYNLLPFTYCPDTALRSVCLHERAVTICRLSEEFKVSSEAEETWYYLEAAKNRFEVLALKLGQSRMRG